MWRRFVLVSTVRTHFPCWPKIVSNALVVKGYSYKIMSTVSIRHWCKSHHVHCFGVDQRFKRSLPWVLKVLTCIIREIGRVGIKFDEVVMERHHFIHQVEWWPLRPLKVRVVEERQFCQTMVTLGFTETLCFSPSGYNW